MSKEGDALLKCVCLVRARLSRSSVTVQAPVASLVPVACLQTDAVGEKQITESGLSFWQEQSALRSVLGIFAGNVLQLQHRQRQASLRLGTGYLGTSSAPLSPSPSSRSPIAYSSTTTSGLTMSSWALLPIAEEGLYIQVPSGAYINACRQWLIAGAVERNSNTEGDPVESYIDSLNFCNAENARSSAEHEPAAPCTLYGYAFFLAEEPPCGEASSLSLSPSSEARTPIGKNRGIEESGLVLCLIAASPVFGFMRALTTQFVPVLCNSVRSAMKQGSVGVDDAALLRALYSLQPLTNPRSACCATLPGKTIQLTLPFPVNVEDLGLPSQCGGSIRGSVLSIPRPYDVYHPLLDLPLSFLLLSFSQDALRVLRSLLLQERRVVFVGMTPQHASACAVSAPALIAPLKWVSPLVSYLSPAHLLACGGLGALFAKDAASGGLLVGSTPALVPALLILWRRIPNAGASGPAQLRNNYSSHPSNNDNDNNPREAVWIADARTGNVSVLWPDGVTKVLEILPESDKLKAAIKKCVASEGHLAFRTALEAVAACYVNDRAAYPMGRKSGMIPQPLQIGMSPSDREDFSEVYESFSFSRDETNIDSNRFGECEDDASESTPGASKVWVNWSQTANEGPPTFPEIAAIHIAEVHAALLDNNAQLLFGNYRKGLQVNSCSPLARSGTPKTITTINSLAYLICNLDMHHSLANHLCHTHHVRQFEHALVKAELLGLQSVLRGDYICSRTGAATQNLAPREQRASFNPYVSNPRLVALLNLFYEHSKRRFPDLFPDLLIVDGVRYCHRVATMALGLNVGRGSTPQPPAAPSDPLIEVLAGRVGGDRNYRPESGSSIRNFFAKATKAVRQSIAGGSADQIVSIPFPDFAHTFTSFARSTGSNGASAVTLWQQMVPPSPSKKGFSSAEFDSNVEGAAHRVGGAADGSAIHRVGLSVDGNAARSREGWARAVSQQARETLLGLEYALPDTYTAVMDTMLSAPSSNEVNHVSATTPDSDDCCPALCMDVIHQFNRYHPLLCPDNAAETPFSLQTNNINKAAALAISIAQIIPTSRRLRHHAEVLGEQVLKNASREDEVLARPMPTNAPVSAMLPAMMGTMPGAPSPNKVNHVSATTPDPGNCCPAVCMDVNQQFDRYYSLPCPGNAAATPVSLQTNNNNNDSSNVAVLPISPAQIIPTRRQLQPPAEVLSEQALKNANREDEALARPMATNAPASVALLTSVSYDNWGEFTSGVPEDYVPASPAAASWSTAAMPCLVTPTTTPLVYDETNSYLLQNSEGFCTPLLSRTAMSPPLASQASSKRQPEVAQHEGERAVKDLDELFM